MKIHESITFDRLEAAILDQSEGVEYPGFCVKCGAVADGVEPDAREYDCEACSTAGTVYGAEELVLMTAA